MAVTWKPPPRSEQESGSLDIEAAACHFDVDLTEKSWHDLMH